MKAIRNRIIETKRVKASGWRVGWERQFCGWSSSSGPENKSTGHSTQKPVGETAA